MADDFSSSSADAAASAASLSHTFDGLQLRANSLAVTAGSFARAMSQAFIQSAIGGKQLDDVLKSVALRLSNLAVTAALKPIAGGLLGGLDKVFANLFGGAFGGGGKGLQIAAGAIKPFAAGGVISTPSYFPLATGGLGLAGEAGPEAIMPLARGRDGRLGVATSGALAPNLTIQISTPDIDSFRRSESYLTGQIARAVARGQRSL